MNRHVGVIGAGWYGCHISVTLKSLGFSIKLFEKNVRVLDEASGNNQFRLHMGFHYPRHYKTRMQSRDGYSHFLNSYPDLSGPVGENIYAVPLQDSLIDFQTYRLIMTASGIDFEDTEQISIQLKGISGTLITKERILLIAKARKYFLDLLGDSLNLGSTISKVTQTDEKVIINGEYFDYAIDATWGHLCGMPMLCYYEPTILLYYKTEIDCPAVTLVDGALCSIYPTEKKGVYTLSSVLHTPLKRVSNAVEARRVRSGIGKRVVSEKRTAMEDQISTYFPSFRDAFTFVGPQLSIKTKPIGLHDDRSCYVFKNGRVLSVMSGKIDTIFYSTERILALIQEHEDDV